MIGLTGRVAVVTGAASGIGAGLAHACADAGMRVVAADIDVAALDASVDALQARGADVIGVRVDVSSPDDVRHLADAAFDGFGSVHLVCSNAGVGMRGLAWEQSESDWQWLLGVNLWGTIHMIAAFVPRMIEQSAHGVEGHVVVTASIAGLLPGSFSAPYNTAKAGVVALAESLAFDLAEVDAPIGVSVLCPGFVRSNILESPRHRPQRFAPGPAVDRHPTEIELESRFRAGIEQGTDPHTVALEVLDAVRTGRFWVLPHRQYDELIAARTDGLLHGGAPPAARQPR